MQTTRLNVARSFASEHCSVCIFCDTLVYIQIFTQQAQLKPRDEHSPVFLVTAKTRWVDWVAPQNHYLTVSFKHQHHGFLFQFLHFKGVSQPITFNTKLSILLLTLRDNTTSLLQNRPLIESSGLDTKMRWCLESKTPLWQYLAYQQLWLNQMDVCLKPSKRHRCDTAIDMKWSFK